MRGVDLPIFNGLERRVACSGVVGASGKAWRQVRRRVVQARCGGLGRQGGCARGRREGWRAVAVVAGSAAGGEMAESLARHGLPTVFNVRSFVGELAN